MTAETPRLRFAELLQEVASGETPSQEALHRAQEWAAEATGTDELLNNAYHFLVHFHEDAEIRAKNQKYATGQVKGLFAWAERLRNAEERMEGPP